MLKKSSKSIKIYYLLLYVAGAITVVYFIKPIYFISILLVLGPPSFANFFWLKKTRLKIALFSIAAALLLAPPIELMTRVADDWDVASVFPRLFGYIPIENMIFAFFNFFWVLSFYEYFINGDVNKNISGKFKYLVGLYCVFMFLVLALFLYDRELIKMNYFTMSVPILIIPSIFIFSLYPRLIKKTIIPTIFFAFVFFIYEMISMDLGHWWWPGKYLFSFNINGLVFPLDDVVIWYLLSTPTLIGGYEFFINDSK